MVLGMLFSLLSNADFWFDIVEFTWKSYSATKILCTPNRVEQINKREFANVILDENSDIFMKHVVTLETMSIHLFRTSQVLKSLLWPPYSEIKLLTKFQSNMQIIQIFFLLI